MPFTESLVSLRRGSLPPSGCLQNESTATAESRRVVEGFSLNRMTRYAGRRSGAPL
jgi:hypothetical protein